ncbi:hypothetical protein HDU91_007346 [Kappamyces sp. JEL0680]|nr:hypothetical protein HDU91_007346 [Kappamyces sp. JEL0680]
MNLTLSPGVKLRTQMMAAESIAVQPIASTKVSTKAKKRPDSIIAPEIQLNPTQKQAWMVIYDLLQHKRQAFRKEWEEQVKAHSVAAKERLAKMKVLHDKAVELQKNTQPKKSAKYTAVYHALPPKPVRPVCLEVELRKLSEDGAADLPSPIETEKVHIKREGSKENNILLKPAKSANPEIQTIPTFRHLSVDDRVSGWKEHQTTSRSQHLLAKRNLRAKQILHMSDSILKNRASSMQTLQRCEGAIRSVPDSQGSGEDSLLVEIQIGDEKVLSGLHAASATTESAPAKELAAISLKIVSDSRKYSAFKRVEVKKQHDAAELRQSMDLAGHSDGMLSKHRSTHTPEPALSNPESTSQLLQVFAEKKSDIDTVSPGRCSSPPEYIYFPPSKPEGLLSLDQLLRQPNITVKKTRTRKLAHWKPLFAL